MQLDWWTLALQTINVVILVWLLGRFFFKPILAIVAERQAAAEKALADIDAARETVAKAHQEADDMRARIAEERETLIAEARQAAKAEHDAMIAQAHSAVAGMRTRTEDELAHQRTVAEDALLARASELSVAIARRLLRRLPPEAALDAFTDSLCTEIRRLPEPERITLSGERLQLITAVPVDQDRQNRLQQLLDAAFGRPVQLDFGSDAELIAGIELRGRDAVITNSWKSDLEKVNEELKRDNGQSGPVSRLA